jgi:hypothetical protein
MSLNSSSKTSIQTVKRCIKRYYISPPIIFYGTDSTDLLKILLEKLIDKIKLRKKMQLIKHECKNARQ